MLVNKTINSIGKQLEERDLKESSQRNSNYDGNYKGLRFNLQVISKPAGCQRYLSLLMHQYY